MSAKRLHSELMSPVDNAWYHMDTITNLAQITGVMTFEEPLNYERLTLTIERRLLIHNRFRQRVIEARTPLSRAHWEDVLDLDINELLHRTRLPEPADHQSLQRMVSELMSIPLDITKPLWQIYYVENYYAGSALICRLHHCIADGIALMQILLSMTDDSPDAPLPEVAPEQSETELSPFARMLVPPIKTARMVNHTLRRGDAFIHNGMQYFKHPAKFSDSTKQTTDAIKALGKLLLIPPDKKTLFRGKCGIPKQAVWTVSIKVDEVKAIGNRMGGTVNDILLSALTGALRRYLEEHGQTTEGLNIRAVVPVNLRPEAKVGELGNQFGLVFLSLPIGIKDPIRRLVLLKRRMNDIKDSPEAIVAIGILSMIGLTPKQIEDIIITIFGVKGTAVMTNVPGPRNTRYLGGTMVKSLMFWVPSPANLSLGVSILSYNGDVSLGVASDEGIVPDPDSILTAFHEEFEFLKAWGRSPESKSISDKSPSAGRDEADDHPKVETPNQCVAMTKEGHRCKNRSLEGNKYCRVHQE